MLAIVWKVDACIGAHGHEHTSVASSVICRSALAIGAHRSLRHLTDDVTLAGICAKRGPFMASRCARPAALKAWLGS